MNTKHLIAITIALVGTGAFASEATQFNDFPNAPLRAEVTAQPARVQASSKVDASYATYQRVVLGDTRIAAPATAVAATDTGHFVPGPFARYLVLNGTSATDAIAQAKAMGEQPSFVTGEAVRTARQLSTYEQYQRSVLGRSDFDVAGNRMSPLNSETNASVAPTPAR